MLGAIIDDSINNLSEILWYHIDIDISFFKSVIKYNVALSDL